jgi:hypothetical protein
MLRIATEFGFTPSSPQPHFSYSKSRSMLIERRRKNDMSCLVCKQGSSLRKVEVGRGMPIDHSSSVAELVPGLPPNDAFAFPSTTGDRSCGASTSICYVRALAS